MKTILSFGLVLLILTAIALGSGIYNIAATEKHWSATEKLIEWVRDNSIHAHAGHLEVPPLDNPDLIMSGAVHYDAMCTGCHLAPGIKPTELSIGLYPQAPVFHQREVINDPAEMLNRAKAYFWVIKNGIKMTAMPAWGLSHDDASVWGMTAFVLKMSGMTPEQYRELTHSAQEHSHSHGGHEHE